MNMSNKPLEQKDASQLSRVRQRQKIRTGGIVSGDDMRVFPPGSAMWVIPEGDFTNEKDYIRAFYECGDKYMEDNPKYLWNAHMVPYRTYLFMKGMKCDSDKTITIKMDKFSDLKHHEFGTNHKTLLIPPRDFKQQTKLQLWLDDPLNRYLFTNILFWSLLFSLTFIINLFIWIYSKLN